MDGKVLQGLVPFFDLANHDAIEGSQLAKHCIRAEDLQPEQPTQPSRRSDGWQDSARSAVPLASNSSKGEEHSAGETAPTHSKWTSVAMFGVRGVGWASGGNSGDRHEFRISYGEKGSRALMEQYGFVVPANPYDGLGDWLERPSSPPLSSAGAEWKIKENEAPRKRRKEKDVFEKVLGLCRGRVSRDTLTRAVTWAEARLSAQTPARDQAQVPQQNKDQALQAFWESDSIPTPSSPAERKMGNQDGAARLAPMQAERMRNACNVIIREAGFRCPIQTSLM